MILPIAVRPREIARPLYGGRSMLVPVPASVEAAFASGATKRYTLRLRCNGCARVVAYGDPTQYRYNFSDRAIEVIVPKKSDCDHELIFEYLPARKT